MRASLPKILALLLIVMSCSSAASAATIQVGVFSYDTGTPAGDSFSVTNLTGLNALPPDFPLEPLLTFTITNFSASLLGGGTLAIDPSKFSTDASGNVNCLSPGDAGAGDCNFAAYDLLSATISGTLSPVAVTGLPAGFIGIESAFIATLTPTCNRLLTAGCDAVVIEATLVPETPQVPVPEPSTAMLLQLGLGALAVYKLRKSPISNRLRRRRP